MTHEPTSESETDLRDESRQFALLVNSVTDYALYMLDPSGVIQTWNPGGQRIKGYQAADVVGTNFSRFYLPEEAQAGLPERNLRTAALEGRYVAEGWRLRQDGTRFRASVVIDPIWEDGELVGFAKITRDITQRHEAQEQLLQAQRDLLQAQKMEAIGKFTLGLAHDFNNLLTIVANCLDLISLRVKNGGVAKLIDTAQRAAERGALLTRQLLTFGKGQTLVPEAVDLAALMAECEAMLRRSAGDAIALTVEVSGAFRPCRWTRHSWRPQSLTWCATAATPCRRAERSSSRRLRGKPVILRCPTPVKDLTSA